MSKNPNAPQVQSNPLARILYLAALLFGVLFVALIVAFMSFVPVAAQSGVNFAPIISLLYQLIPLFIIVAILGMFAGWKWGKS